MATTASLQGLVEDIPLTTINYLTLNREYLDTGGNDALSIEPPVVHFSGFVPGGSSKPQAVRLCNRTTRNTRIHVILPSSSPFKVVHKRPPGNLAPGMSEELIVQFSSDQARYHYDCIRIQTAAGNLLLPLHAYPLPNQPTFPKRLDLGRAALGDTVTRTVPLSCQVPIEVAFELSWQPQVDCLSITPTSGVIPAGEAVELLFSYTPTTYTTQRLELQVRLVADNAEPLVCEVSASCAPGVARDTLLQTAGTTVVDVLARSSGVRSPAGSLPRPFNKGGGSPRGGAGGGDAYTLQQYDITSTRRTRDCRVDGPLQSKLPRQRPKPAELQMGGTLVPRQIASHTDVAYVLNQQPGKLQTQDIKAAIAQRREQLAADTAVLEDVLAAGQESGVHPFNQPSTGAGVKDALFQLELQKVAAAAKRCTGLVGRDGGLVGEDPPTPEQIAAAQEAQQAAMAAHQQQLELEAAHRLDAEMQVGGALHVLPTPTAEDLSTTSTTSSSTLAAKAAGEEYPGLEGWQPHWVLLEANTWRKRVAVLQRFVAAARVVILRNRAERRLRRLRALAAQLRSVGEDALAGAAIQEVVLEASLVSRPGVEPRKLLLPEQVVAWPLPLYRPEPFAAHPEVRDMPEVGEFTELLPAPLQSEYEYKLLGYIPEEFPGWINYMPPLEDQPLLELAADEVPGARPACILPPALAAISSTCPDALRQMPYVSLEIGSRSSGTQAHLAPTPAWGLALPYLVQPRVYPYHDSCQLEAPSSCSLRALAGAPQLSDRWRASKAPWRVLPTQPPVLLSGPDVAHLLPPGVEDADKPAVGLRPPTQLAPYLADLPDGVVPQPSWVRGDAADAAADPSSGDAAGLGAGQAGGHGGSSSSSGGGASTGSALACQLPHQHHQQELDKGKDAKAQQQLQQLVRSTQEYNQRLSRQHRQAIQL